MAIAATVIAGQITQAMSDVATAQQMIQKAMTDIQEGEKRTASAALDELSKTNGMIMQGKIDGMKNMNYGG